MLLFSQTVNMNKEVILTETGKQGLLKELKELREVKRPDIIQKIEEAKEMGDLSENAEYHDAKDQQGIIQSRIAEIEDILKNAVVSKKATSKEIIQMGADFVVKDSSGKERELTLVGYNEADPLSGKISNESPMGQAFLGKKPGESVNVETPRGDKEYTIVKIK